MDCELRNFTDNHLRVVISPVAYNEVGKIENVIMRLKEVLNTHPSYSVCVVDDGSTDATPSLLKNSGLPFIHLPMQRGVGTAIRTAVAYAEENKFDVLVIMAGNDKDRPHEIPELIKKIEEGYDFVIGSRYLKGGLQANTPFYRVIATRYIHPWLVWLTTGRKLIDTVNGLRAIRMSFFRDQRINLNQEWLNGYECEQYKLYKAITLGYRIIEVPVSKIYPPRAMSYTKIKPFSGWWQIIRPFVYLWLGIKK